jgi:hypothetical protein
METNKKRIWVMVVSIVFSLMITEKSTAFLDIFLKDNSAFFAPEDIYS